MPRYLRDGALSLSGGISLYNNANVPAALTHPHRALPENLPLHLPSPGPRGRGFGPCRPGIRPRGVPRRISHVRPRDPACPFSCLDVPVESRIRDARVPRDEPPDDAVFLDALRDAGSRHLPGRRRERAAKRPELGAAAVPDRGGGDLSHGEHDHRARLRRDRLLPGAPGGHPLPEKEEGAEAEAPGKPRLALPPAPDATVLLKRSAKCIVSQIQ